MKKYRVWAGEGERGSIGGYATTLKGAKRIATRESCNGDRWTRIEMNLEGEKNSMGEELTGWINIEE